MSNVDVSTNRVTGRTLSMVRALDAKDRPALIVHTNAMAQYLRRMLQEVRPDIDPPLHIFVVARARDTDRFRGLRFVVDHALWDSPDVSTEAKLLLRALGRYYQEFDRRLAGATKA